MLLNLSADYFRIHICFYFNVLNCSDKLVNCNKCFDKPDKIKFTRVSSFNKIELKWQTKL